MVDEWMMDFFWGGNFVEVGRIFDFRWKTLTSQPLAVHHHFRFWIFDFRLEEAGGALQVFPHIGTPPDAALIPDF
jgi:hypothetical protein